MSTIFSTASVVRRTRTITASQAVRLLPHSVALASVMSVAVVALQRLVQSPSANGRPIVSWAALALVASLAFVSANRGERDVVLPRGVDPNGFTAYLLALELGILLLPVAVYLAVWKNRYDTYSGWTYPFLNKRWLVALYGLAIAVFLIFPSAVARWLRRGAVSDRVDAFEFDPPFAVHERRRLRLAGGIAAAVLTAYYFAGPPWHVDRHHRAIDFHEQVHLGQLQAIDKGYVPYIGPASTQYGPGSQILTYAWMKLSGRFDIVSFREAEIAFHLITVTTVAVLGYTTAGVWGMLAVVFLALAYSPLTFFFVGGDGSFAGSYGWGNGLRYLGCLLVTPALARVACRPHAPGRLIRPALALGIVWGFFAWVSQENFGTTGVATALIFAILWLTDTASARSVTSVALSAAAGFVSVWAIVLMYYAAHSAAGEFIRAYFLVASAVAMGFQNTWWNPGDPPGHLSSYYFTAPLAIALGVATLCELPRLTMRQHMTERQVRLLSFVCVLLACYQTTLYRSDYVHLQNTMLALPFVLVLALLDLPEWAARTWLARAFLRVALAALAIYVYPIGHVVLDPYAWLIGPPATRFRSRVDDDRVFKDGRVPFRRATRYLSDEPQTAPGMVPMRTFLEAGSELRDLIGTRRTFVDGIVAGGYTGLYYFMLDLTPGPILFEKETMTINNVVAEEAFDHFRRHVREFDAVLTATPDSRESQAFRAAHPRAVTVTRSIGEAPVYVILSEQS